MKSIFELFVGSDTNVVTKEKWIEKKLSDMEPGKSILDAGAGELKWKDSCKHLKYTSQDFAQYNGNVNDNGLQITDWKYPHIDIVSDICDIPVENESFDYVLCSEVLEHLPDPNKAIKELVRVTKKGGEIIITAPFCSLTHMAPYHYCTGFNKYWYQYNFDLLECDIVECISNGDFYSWLRQEVLRLPFVYNKYNKKNSYILKLRCYWFAHYLYKLIKLYDESCELLCFEYLVVIKKR